MKTLLEQHQQELLDITIQHKARGLRAACGSCSVCCEIRAMLLGAFGPVTELTLQAARSQFPGCYCE